MKNLTFTFFISLGCFTCLFAQAPQKMSYQSVIRDANGQLKRDANLGMQISVLQGSETGTPVFVERHFPKSNTNGLVTLEIGGGLTTQGNFSNIDWSQGPYFIKTETDVNGGANYTISGTSQLLSIPYALYAKNVENVPSLKMDDLKDVNVTNAQASQVLKWNGTEWTAANDNTGGGSGPTYTPGQGISIDANNVIANSGDLSSTNEIQQLSLSGNLLTLSQNGGAVTLPSSGGGSGDNWGSQVVSVTGALDGNGLGNNPLKIKDNSINTSLIQDGTIIPSDLNANVGNPGQVLMIDADLKFKMAKPTDYTFQDGFNVSTATGTWPNPTIISAKDVSPTNELQDLTFNATTKKLSLTQSTATVDLSSLAGSSSPWLQIGSNIYYTGGKVGIGTNNPSNELSIVGPIGSNPKINITAQTSTNAGTSLVLEAGGINTIGVLKLLNLQPEGGSVKIGDPAAKNIHFFNNEISSFGTTELNLQSGGGQVRFGPSTAPHIYANSNGSLEIYPANSNVPKLKASIQTNASQSVGYLNLQNKDNRDGIVMTHSPADGYFSWLKINDLTGNDGVHLIGSSSGGNVKITNKSGFGLQIINTTTNQDQHAIRVNAGIASGLDIYNNSASKPTAYFENQNTTTNGYALRVKGRLHVDGTLSKNAGSFRIDHPLDPENKYLYHSFVESPDMMNIYNGNVTTDENGIAVVELPTYFEALNIDFRYQLTPIGCFSQIMIKEEIEGNKFVLQSEKPNVKVSWQVTGIRNDEYARNNRIIPEVKKE